MQNILPNFEANQVLSNAHLNQIVAYLEEQGRLTRNHLLGNGIVSGLEIRRDSNTSLAITEGVGVSSAGYLLIPESVNSQTDARGKRFIAYNKKRKFEPKFLLFPYRNDLVNTFNDYELFSGLKIVWQLVETSVADDIDPVNVTKLESQDLNDHIAILFLQIQVKELKSCEADSCMELGRQWTYTVVPLLIHKDDADRLLQNEKTISQTLPVGSDPDPLVNPAYHLPDLPLARPEFASITETASRAHVVELYKAVIRELSTELQDAKYARADTSLQVILKDNFSVKPLSDFKQKIDELMVEKSAVSRKEYFTYVYDFAKDFCLAYRELQDAVFEYHSFEIPDSISFPHHLRLGGIPQVGDVANSNIYPPVPYRHGFTSSRNVEQQQEAWKDVTILYRRLISLTRDFTTVLNVNDIRITPSIESARAFSYRAIPFYYKTGIDGRPMVLSVWSPLWHRQNKLNRVLNYYDNANTTDKFAFRNNKNILEDEPLFAPISYYHEDKDFYRVEGHLGATYTDVFSTVQQYIKNYNLSFDLQLVRLNKATVMPIKDKHILFSDLESLHNVVKEEIRSLLTTELNYFNNIRLTKIVSRSPRQQAAVATDALKTSSIVSAELKTDQPLLMTMMLSKQPASKFFGETKEIQVTDFGVTDSMAFYTSKFDGKVSANDIANLLTGVGSIGIINNKTTPAAPFISRIVAAINAFNKVMDVPFDNFKIADYQAKLATVENETKAFVLFSKNLSDALLRSESNIVKGELLDYLDRILFECDFEKIPAVDNERIRREEQVGVNNFLQQYIGINPGVEHRSGVNKGGTFVVVFDELGTVITDISLPYRCCAGTGGTQFVLGVLKTILLAGQVLDVDNVPVKTATVILNDETLVLDDTAHFKKAVQPNSFLLLKISAPGFEPGEIQIKALEDDILQNITLFTKAQELKINFILTVASSDGTALPDAIAKLNDDLLPLDATGTFKGQIKANANFALTVELGGFKTFTQVFSTTVADQSINAILSKLISISGVILDPTQKPVPNANVFINGVLNKGDADGKFMIKELEGTGTYNLVIEAPDLEKLVDTIKPNNVDVVKTYQLQRIATLSVRVGVYIASNPVFDPRLTRAGLLSTTGGLAAGLTDIAITRVSGTGRLSTGGISRFDRGSLIGGGGIVNRDPAVPAANGFEFLTNKDVNTEVDGIAQQYDDNLRLFKSDEKKAQHKLTVQVKPVRLAFTVPLSVTDLDLIVLVPARQNYKPEAMFSILPNGDAGNLKVCNDFFVSQFSLAAGINVITRPLEFRFFTSAEATEFAELLKASRVKFITTTQGL